MTGTFNVPAPLKSISCLEETSVWVGIDGLHNHDLLQAGVAERGFTVPSSRTQTTWPAPVVAPLLCGGRAQIYAWWEDLPSGPVQVDLPVHVDDSLTVSIFKMSPGWWALALHDLTAKRSFFLAQRYDGPQTSVEWVVEAPDVMGLTRGPSRSARWTSTTSTPTVMRTAWNASPSPQDATSRPRRAWWQAWPNSGAPASRSRGPGDQSDLAGTPRRRSWTERRPCAPKNNCRHPRAGRHKLRRAPAWFLGEEPVPGPRASQTCGESYDGRSVKPSTQTYAEKSSQ